LKRWRLSYHEKDYLKMSHEATSKQPNDYIRVSDLPQIIDDVQKGPLGFIVVSGGERILFRFGSGMTPKLRLELEILADEFRPVRRAA
jgi:hypothetical protein